MRIRSFSFIIAVFLFGCQSATEERKVICKVKAELLLPMAYGDSTNVKELFFRRLELLYPKAIEGTILRNGGKVSPGDFTYEIAEPKYTDRIIQFYLSSYKDCNCRNIQDTLLYQLHEDFLERFPDNRTVENELKMEQIADKLDSLTERIEATNSIKYIVEHGIHVDTMKKWEEQYLNLLQEKEELRIADASYLYEFFTIISSGSNVK